MLTRQLRSSCIQHIELEGFEARFPVNAQGFRPLERACQIRIRRCESLEFKFCMTNRF
jgi:hypothetical protein